jgi:hypothetical protein
VEKSCQWKRLHKLTSSRSCLFRDGNRRYSRWLDPGQLGRELTVYVYTFDEEYDVGHKGGPLAGMMPMEEEHLTWLGREFEAPYHGRFWFLFIQEASGPFKTLVFGSTWLTLSCGHVATRTSVNCSKSNSGRLYRSPMQWVRWSAPCE